MSEKAQRYKRIAEHLKRVTDGEADVIARMSSAACLLHAEFDNFLWTGFYRLRGSELVVGPYQGRLGCLRIPLGRGVCGTAAQKESTIIVDDVHAFPGHITCDARAKSEIVVPVFDARGELLAVLDVDSDAEASFDLVDKEGLEQVVAIVGGR